MTDLNKREKYRLRSKEYYKNLPAVVCDCGDTVKEFLFANHINSVKHFNKLTGLTRTEQAKIRYQESPDIECTCGKIVKRYYLIKHLKYTSLHRNGRNPMSKKLLDSYLNIDS